jgi:hypothetical protein
MTVSRDADPASTGIDHLNAAAREMIAAARSFLDAAEEVVNDREQFTRFASAIGGAADSFARLVRPPQAADPTKSTGTRVRSVPLEDD